MPLIIIPKEKAVGRASISAPADISQPLRRFQKEDGK